MLAAMPQASGSEDQVVVPAQQGAGESIPLMEPSVTPDYIDSRNRESSCAG
jgi:hypothetical protein